MRRLRLIFPAGMAVRSLTEGSFAEMVQTMGAYRRRVPKLDEQGKMTKVIEDHACPSTNFSNALLVAYGNLIARPEYLPKFARSVDLMKRPTAKIAVTPQNGKKKKR